MRIAVLAFSTVLLSGCSWLGFGGNKPHHSKHQSYGSYGQQATHHQGKRANPCQIPHASAPIPRGCRPEQVTIGTQKSYAQNSYGGYSNQGYSRAQKPSAGSYGQANIPTTGGAWPTQTHVPNRYDKRPRLRLNGSLGAETSISGEALSSFALTDIYNPAAHTEGPIQVGSQPSGSVTTTNYSVEDIVPRAPQTTFSDLYAAPLSVGIGAEYLVTPKVSVTAEASYAHAAGRKGGGVTYEGDIREDVLIENYTTNLTTGAPTLSGTTSNSTILENLPVAYAEYSVNDLKRSSFEAGAKYYFDPAFEQYMERPLIPYVGISAGGAHYNALEVKQDLYQLFLQDYWESGRLPEDLSYYREAETAPTELIEAGWVPTGTLVLGAEWQVRENASIGFETGVRFEGARDRTDGSETGDNYSIPLKIRGSIGF